ncbi:MAG: 23S rRNA (guanosine(2251)-2'-O)-methyltransferase RlmB [Pseudomonadota bacterium]
MSNSNYIYGFHAVKASLNQLDDDLTKQGSSGSILYIDKQRRDKRILQLFDLVKKKPVKTIRISKAELDKLTSGNHQGVVFHQSAAQQKSQHTSSIKTEAFLDELLENIAQQHQNYFFLLLDSVQDPHNLGACLRTADAAGIQAIIIPKDRAVSLTPVVRKVASGADQYVPVIQVTNLARTMDLLKRFNIWLIGTAGEAENDVYSADLTGNLAIVMGAEEKGLRRLTREKCDSLVNIPMNGHVESLNVSVSTGICLFEALRQRMAK